MCVVRIFEPLYAWPQISPSKSYMRCVYMLPIYYTVHDLCEVFVDNDIKYNMELHAILANIYSLG